MFGRNCKMHIYFTILISCIERTLYKMFFQRCTVTVFISVEFQQTFRQCTVIQSCSFKQCSNYGFIVSFRHQRRNIFSGHLLTGSIQIIIESEFFNLFKECLFKFSFGGIIISSEKFEQILEHTARCTGCRNKLHYNLICPGISVPCIEIELLLICCRSQNSFFQRSGSSQLQIWKTFLETSQLFGYLFF